MFIYISDTCSVQPGRFRLNRDKVEKDRIKKIQEVVKAIAKKGHLPIVPYTLMPGWNDIDEISENLFRQICYNWLQKCDAIYFVTPSIHVDAKIEQQIAINRNLPVYYNLDDIPEELITEPTTLRPQAFQAYLIEYQQCMENFRHIFATIWQAGALFAAISAGILAFSGSPILGNTLTGIPPLIQVLVPIPVIFWYLGIYRPMNRYCELDNDRLVQIEHLLNNAVPGLEMSHFRTFSSSRKKEGFVKRLVRFKWLLKPRVVEIVTLFGCSLILTEIYLLWANYLSHWL
jgi:hypothetical protein